jgi:hypothetical protein
LSFSLKTFIIQIELIEICMSNIFEAFERIGFVSKVFVNIFNIKTLLLYYLSFFSSFMFFYFFYIYGVFFVFLKNLIIFFFIGTSKFFIIPGLIKTIYLYP